MVCWFMYHGKGTTLHDKYHTHSPVTISTRPLPSFVDYDNDKIKLHGSLLLQLILLS